MGTSEFRSFRSGSLEGPSCFRGSVISGFGIYRMRCCRYKELSGFGLVVCRLVTVIVVDEL